MKGKITTIKELTVVTVSAIKIYLFLIILKREGMIKMNEVKNKCLRERISLICNSCANRI